MAQTWARVHGDGEEPVAVAQGIVAQTGFLRSKKQSDAFRLQSVPDLGVTLGQGKERMFFSSFPDGCGAQYQAAVFDSLGDGKVLRCLVENGGGVYRGAGFFQGEGVV